MRFTLSLCFHWYIFCGSFGKTESKIANQMLFKSDSDHCSFEGSFKITLIKKMTYKLSGLLMKVSLHLFIKLQQIIQPFSEGQASHWGNDWFPLLHQGSLRPRIRNCSAQVFWSQSHIYSHNFLLCHIITQGCQPGFEAFPWWFLRASV